MLVQLKDPSFSPDDYTLNTINGLTSADIAHPLLPTFYISLTRDISSRARLGHNYRPVRNRCADIGINALYEPLEKVGYIYLICVATRSRRHRRPPRFSALAISHVGISRISRRYLEP